MSEDGYLFKFSRGQDVFRKGEKFFIGTVLGYIQKLDKQWYCCVETASGNLYMVIQDELNLVKVLPKLQHSK